MKSFNPMRTWTVVALLCLFSACTKKDNPTTITEKNLYGTWEKTFDATDENNNGRLDENEKKFLQTYEGVQLILAKDGTYNLRVKVSGIWTDRPGNWWLEDDVLMREGSGVSSAAKINKLTSKQLLLQPIAPGKDLHWASFER